jgi:hypothetical protein
MSDPHASSFLANFKYESMPQRRLKAATVPVAALDGATRRAAFALLEHLYDGTDLARFQRDLAEKRLAILLRDRDTGALKGFSTVALSAVPTASGPGTAVFSGDTAIDREYWGQKLLQREFGRLLLRLKLAAPGRPLYWFLISKGYRTYLLLANAFSRAIPRHDRPDDPTLRRLLNHLAAERFGRQYDPESGTIRYDGPHDRVRSGVAPLDQSLLRNPHVRFFVSRNPGHAAGDELACLAEARLKDLLRAVARIGFARTRLRWRAR